MAFKTVTSNGPSRVCKRLFKYNNLLKTHILHSNEIMKFLISYLSYKYICH
jgi:hypothetical protein